jgi:O-antigen/teichoic acid export membrane protein
MRNLLSRRFPEWVKLRGVSFSEANSIAFWPFADQGAVSLGNFLTQIILARNLTTHDYGVFGLLFVVMYLLNNCHSPLVAYPLSVRGAVEDLSGLRRLCTVSLVFTAALMVPGAIVLAGATSVLKVLPLLPFVLLGSVLWQTQETTRRGLMAWLRHREALWGDALSYMGQAAVLWLLAISGRLTLTTVFLTVAGTSAVAALVQMKQIGLARIGLSHIRKASADFWRLGRWAFGASATGMAVNAVFPWGLNFFQGPECAAAYQAANNVLGASHPVLFGVSNLVVPATARERRKGGIRAGAKPAVRYGLQGALLVAPYYVALLIWPHLALSLFYGHSSSYLDLGTAVRIFATAYFASYAFMAVSAFLNGVEKSFLVLRSDLAGTGALVLAIPLAARYGVRGACAGYVVVNLVRGLCATWFAIGLAHDEDRSRSGLMRGALQVHSEGRSQ